MPKHTKPWYNDVKYYGYHKARDEYQPMKHLWRSARRRHWVAKYARAKGCETCAENRKYTLCFDHMEPSKKSFGVLGANIEQRTYRELTDEIRKCRVLCHNCHAIKTNVEGDGGRTMHCSEKQQQDFERYQNDKTQTD